MEMLYPIIGAALSFWLLTSSKFRKANGQVVSDIITESAGGMLDTVKMNRLNAKLDFADEIKSNGFTKESVQAELDFVNSLIK